MTSKKSSQLGEKLLQRGRTPNTESAAVILPVNEMPMVLTLEQLRPNPDNPRTSRKPYLRCYPQEQNSKYLSCPNLYLHRLGS